MNYLIARVSDPDQKKALPAQKKKLDEYAEKLGWVEGKDFVYIEFDETAFKEQRKDFRALVIKPLQEQKEPAIVVFDKIDRFSRDTYSEDKNALIKMFRAGKIELHFPSDSLFINKDSSAGELFRLDVGVALASYYSASIRDGVNRRFDQMLKDGIWVGKAPIGYENFVKRYDDKGEPVEKDIRPDPLRDFHILEGYKLRSTGMSYRAIAKNRKKAGLVSNTELKKAITAAQWEKILENPFYYGKMRYMGVIYKHHYPPIVPAWLWEKCQEVKLMRSNGRTKYNSKKFLFRNLKCSVCGMSITFDGPKKNGRTYCKCTEYKGKHGAKWVDEQVLIDQFKEVLKSIQVPKELLPEIVAEIERNHKSEQKHYLATKERLLKEHKAIDERVKSLFRDRYKFNIKPELFEEMVKEAEKEQESIANQLADHGKADKQFVLGASYILDVASRAIELFEAESTKLEQKRFLIDFVLSNQSFDGEKLVFNLKEPFAALASAQKSQNWYPR